MSNSLRAAACKVVAGLCLASLVQAPSAARADAPIEKALPASTFALIKVESVSDLRKAFSSAQVGQLLADPAMKPLKDQFAQLLEQPNQQVKQAIGLTVNELLDLPQGTLAIALIARDDAKIPVAVLASVDAGENAAKMDEVLTRATQEAEKAGAKVATEDLQGVQAHVIKSDEEDAPPLVWVKQGNTYRFSSDIEALKDLMANAGSGRDESLAASQNFADVVGQVGKDAQVLWYLDIAQAVALGTKAAGENGANAEQVAAQFQILGLNSVKAIGGSFAFGVGDLDSVGKIFVLAPGEAQGIFKLFPMPPANLKPQPWVPASVASYQSFSWDLDKAWEGLNELVDQFAPGVLDQVQKSLSGPNGPGIDLKKDVIGPIGGRITMISDFKKPITEKSQRILAAVALDDAKAFQGTLNKVLELAKASPKKRNFQGATIYDFELPAEIGDASGIAGPVCVTITKDTLFISSEPSLLEQVLRPGAPALADDPEFQMVSKIYPSTAITMSYSEPEQQVRLLYNMIKSGQLQDAIKQAQPDGPDLDKVIDPKLLPEFDVIAKYLSPSGGYGVITPQGAMFTSFTVKKK